MTEQTPIIPRTERYYDDEISISELLLKIWAKRGLVLALPVIFAGLTAIGLLVSKTSHQTEVRYYIELNGISLSRSFPSFESAEEGAVSTADAKSRRLDSGSSMSDSNIVTRYPNGNIFSPQDLTNPTVIATLAGETGLNSQDLAEHIDVQFGTPVSNGVLAEYKAALSSNSKASAQDLAMLNERYDLKLSAAAKRGLKITVDYVGLDVSLDDGERIAALLPKIWNRVYTTQFTSQVSSDIASLRWTEREFEIDSAIGLQEADVQLQSLKRGVELIAADDRLRGIQSSDGTLAADLVGYIDDFRSIFFDPLFLGAFSTDDTLTRVYVQDLQFEISELDREVEELNKRLDDIRDFQGGTQGGTNSGDREAPQLDGNALTTVVNLAEQAALSTYLQSSLDLRYELTKQRAISTTRLERIKSNMGGKQIGKDFIELAEARFRTITNSYRDILKTAQAIMVSNTPSFYSVTTQPSTEGKLLSIRDLLFMALALMLGGMVAIIAALVWPQKQVA